jgi:1-acyl-sn-glycerol-3-phosphate acyltransferase
MKSVHAAWKMVCLGLHIARGLWTVRFVFGRLDAHQKQQRIQAWAHTLLSQLAIKVVVSGQPASQGPMLLAANHISWLDIYLILATCPCRMVAKAEVRQWPVIGSLAQAVGTLFIQRESPRDALRVVHDMAQQLKAGDVLAIFPEGTTSNGLQVLPFHANLFQAAISANAPVQPVALIFEDSATGQPSQVPCYIDDDTLLGSIWRVAMAPPLRVTLKFGELQTSDGRPRRAWSIDVRSEVEALRQRAG